VLIIINNASIQSGLVERDTSGSLSVRVAFNKSTFSGGVGHSMSQVTLSQYAVFVGEPELTFYLSLLYHLTSSIFHQFKPIMINVSIIILL